MHAIDFDAALARVQRGLIGFLDVTGPADPELYRPEPVSAGAP